MEIGRIAAAAVRLPHEGRAPAACVVPFRRLHLDHIGAQIGERLAYPGASQYPRQLEHFQTMQRGIHGAAIVSYGG